MTTRRRRLLVGTCSTLLGIGLILGAAVGPAAAGLSCPALRSDFDGDGNADAAIGEPFRNIGADGNAGRVHIMYGSDAGLSALAHQTWDQDTTGVLGTTQPDDQFGYALASGDFDEDCHADLAISAPGDGTNGLTILYGSPSGLSADGTDSFDIASGFDMAVGDVDDDGDDDLAIGGDGTVRILEGSESGLFQFLTFTQDSAGVPGTDEAGDHWGDALAMADFDGDNYADLAIGAWGENIGSSSSKVNAGSVTILRGSAISITTTGAEVWTQDTDGVPGTAETGDHFGEALAAGELDNSGEADLVIGCPSESIGADSETGSIIVLNGSAGGGLTASDAKSFHQDTSGVPGSNEDGDHFGDALTVGEFNGDGFEDVVVGAPDENVGSIVNAGSVTVLYSLGEDGGLSAADSETFTQDTSGVLGTAETSDRFGAALHASTITGMGHSDLLVGVPTEDTDGATNNGAFNLLLGGGEVGINVTGDEYWSLGNINGTEQDGAQFARGLG